MSYVWKRRGRATLVAAATIAVLVLYIGVRSIGPVTATSLGAIFSPA